VPDRHEGGQADHRPAERLADRQQRDAVQGGLRRRAQAEVRLRRVRRGPRPVGARLGQRPGRHDLRADAHPAAEDRRRARRERRPRQRRDHDPEEAEPQRQGTGHRPGRHRAGPAEHPRRRPVHDRLQGDQEGGRRGRPARHRARQGREAGREPDGARPGGQPGRARGARGAAGDLLRQREGRGGGRLRLQGGAVHRGVRRQVQGSRHAPVAGTSEPYAAVRRRASTEGVQCPRRRPRTSASRRPGAVPQGPDHQSSPSSNCAESTRASAPCTCCTTCPSPPTPGR